MPSKLQLMTSIVAVCALSMGGAHAAPAGCSARSLPAVDPPEASRCAFTTESDTTVHYAGAGKWKINVVLPTSIPFGRWDGSDAFAHSGRSIALLPGDAGTAPRIVVGAPGKSDGSGGGGGGGVVGIFDRALTPAFWLSGGPAGGSFGVSVATGDLDGDGSAEILAGAPGDTGGAVFVFGGDGSFRSAFAPSVPGNYGFCVAAGDVNGDGRADVIATAPDGAGGNGFVTAFDAATGEVLLNVTGAQGEGLGRSLAVADMDRDGLADVIVGTSDGSVAIIDASTNEISRVRVRDSDASFGRAIAVADVDLDGVPDIVVGAPDAPGGGSVTAVSGRSHTFLWDARADLGSSSELGASLAIGDLNGDGRPDIIVGAPGVSKTILLSHEGRLLRADGAPESGGRYGASVAAGDIDGDRFDDIVVGAPFADGAAPPGAPPVAEAGAVVMRTLLKEHFENGDIPSQDDFDAPFGTIVSLQAEPSTITVAGSFVVASSAEF